MFGTLQAGVQRQLELLDVNNDVGIIEMAKSQAQNIVKADLAIARAMVAGIDDDYDYEAVTKN